MQPIGIMATRSNQTIWLGHALPSTIRARDGADADWIVATLMHDVGAGLLQ